MARQRLTRQGLIDLATPLVQYARQAVAAATDHGAAGPSDTPPTRIAWAFLFRTLNLADAALDAARQQRGEALALIARSMQELVFHVKAMARKPDYLGRYAVLSQVKAHDTMRKYRDWLAKNRPTDTATLELYDKALRHPPADGKSVTIRQVAKDADMEQQYLGQYGLLCMETHHNTAALTLYFNDKTDRGQMGNFYPDDRQMLYLRLALLAFMGCRETLFPQCSIPSDPALEEAVRIAVNRLRDTLP